MFSVYKESRQTKHSEMVEDIVSLLPRFVAFLYDGTR